MESPVQPVVSCAVEGPMDEAILKRLARELGADMGLVYGGRGKKYLDHQITNYNKAARFSPWLVLRDMDQDSECAVSLRAHLLPAPEPGMCFRIAVRSVEAWLLADRPAIAALMGVSQDLVPRDPEALDDPKEVLVNLARRSPHRTVREDIVPKPGSGRKQGPGYLARMTDFVEEHWRPEQASKIANSLDRAIRCWRRLLTSA